MSSKTKTTAAKEEAKPVLVPKLRFPEFRGGKAWEEKRLGNEGELYSSLTGKAGADFDAGEARFVTYMNVFSNTFVDPNALRFVDVKEGENQNAVASGDVFFTISSETPDEVGMSSVLLKDLENCYLNSFCALFRFSEGKRPNPVFTGYLLRQPLVRDYFTKKAQGSTRFNLSKDAFRNLPLFVPTAAEQQKIAECLSSLDELMAAQARKVDALKTHKKGLMQQLFPREGETQPRLRFPEFQNAGEWEPETLENLCSAKISYGIVQAGPHVPNGMPYIKSTDLNSELCLDNLARTSEAIAQKYCRSEVVPGDIVFSLRGNIGVAQIVPEGIPVANLTQGTARIRTKGPAEFYFHALRSPTVHNRILAVGKGSTFQEISLEALRNIRLYHPKSAEQQRIATCLSSLDALITAETQKLEALKIHKRGLMQQLFPSPNEQSAP